MPRALSLHLRLLLLQHGVGGLRLQQLRLGLLVREQGPIDVLLLVNVEDLAQFRIQVRQLRLQLEDLELLAPLVLSQRAVLLGKGWNFLHWLLARLRCVVDQALQFGKHLVVHQVCAYGLSVPGKSREKSGHA